MKTDSHKKYVQVRDTQGTDHYCPAETGGTVFASEEFDACVEKDVVERYSGNIEINET